MKCDGRPDPLSTKDINTFINLTKDDCLNILDIRETLKTCEIIFDVNILDLLKSLTKLIIFLQLLLILKCVHPGKRY